MDASMACTPLSPYGWPRAMNISLPSERHIKPEFSLSKLSNVVRHGALDSESMVIIRKEKLQGQRLDVNLWGLENKSQKEGLFREETSRAYAGTHIYALLVLKRIL